MSSFISPPASVPISPATSIPTIDPTVPVEPLWRWSVDQYHAMIRSGLLTEDDPVELLDGWLVVKMPKNPAHSSSTGRTRDAIASILPSGWFPRVQEPITLPTSEPEPDVAVVRGDQHRYAERHPDYSAHREFLPGDEVPLVIEGREVGRIRVRNLLP